MPEQYQFNHIASTNNYCLYKGGVVGEVNGLSSPSWTGYLLPWKTDPKNPSPPATLAFFDSWTKYSGSPINKEQGGCYIFCNKAPSDNSAFVTVMEGLLKILTDKEGFTYRYFFWIDTPDVENNNDLIYNLLPFTSEGELSGTIPNQKNAPLRNNAVSFGNIYIQLPGGTGIKAKPVDNAIEFEQFSNGISLWNSNGAKQFGCVDNNVTLSLTDNPGALTFLATFNTQSIYGDDFSEMQAGIRYFINGENNETSSQLYPLWGAMSDNVAYPIDASLNPLWPEEHERTYFQFSSPATKGESLGSFLSYFTTTYGHSISLRPIASNAKLVFMAGVLNSEDQQRNKTGLFYLAPAGDFVVSKVEHPQNTPAPVTRPDILLCGLNGTEAFSFTSQQADPDHAMVLRFVPDQPAYASSFPFAQASPVGPPIDPSALLLDDTLTTSWISLSSQSESGASQYVSLPKGSPLYGLDNVIHSKDYPQFLGFVDPSSEISLTGSFSFPMVPYRGLSLNQPANKDKGLTGWKKEQVETFERQIISPTRRVKIAQSKPALKPPMSAPPNDGSGTTNTTTPTGLIATINNATGKWSNIFLGKLTNPAETSMYFSEPGDKLQQAFQTSDLMLVVANPANLGTLGGSEGTAFGNSLNIENWVLQAQVGDNYSYGNYSNIVIVKGLKGKLYDPASAIGSLVSNPKKWTQSADFAAPNGKQDELVTLSHWLYDYFKDAASKTGDDALYFEQFNKIAQDENWTGILVLRANIESLPPNIKGMVAGVKDMSAFNAHHFGIEISQTEIGDNGPAIKGASSVFGLIYYNDPAWDSSKPEIPVTPAAGSTYDFRLLDLKVLFENSAVKHFQSYAQLTLNELFGSSVSKMGEGGNIYNSIILRGSFQDNGGVPVYGLGTIQDYVFIMDNNIFNKIEIASAQMTTLSATTTDTNIWFGLTGYLDFKILQQGAGNDALGIDLLSFGSKDGTTPREGLYFSNMGLAMDYPTPTPEKKTFSFTTQNIRFDIESSTIRPGSLYPSFALEVEAMNTGDKENTPVKQGFINIITDLRLSGVDGGDWHGLKFHLNLGTPGELAGKVGLNADLLIAWSNQGGQNNEYKVNVGLHLPGTTNGASLISLQNVLKLSFGPIRLIYAKQNETSEDRNFMLMLTSVALKFLGLMKIPPNGNTIFYLFGNPESEGKTSGLGWYAKYGKSGKDTESTVLLTAEISAQKGQS